MTQNKAMINVKYTCPLAPHMDLLFSARSPEFKKFHSGLLKRLYYTKMFLQFFALMVSILPDMTSLTICHA